jgi:hypothetical protein
MYELAIDLNAETILAEYPQEQIMEHYTGVPIQLNIRFLSPLREDHNPSCGYFYTKDGTLVLKDFAGFFSGGCFKVVMAMFRLNYGETLRRIATDFGMIEGVRVQRKEYPHLAEAKEASSTTIAIRKRWYNAEDAEFWKPFGISRDTLIHFLCVPVELLWLNDRIIYNYKPGDPAYAYCYGDGNYKIYFPKRKANRFICNTTVVQGYQVERDFSKGVVITKSMKDVMVLHEHGITAVAPQSETVYPDPYWIAELKEQAPIVVSLYDFDRAGVAMANYMRKNYGITPYFLTNGRFGSFNYRAKDISDYAHDFGAEATGNLISFCYEVQPRPAHHRNSAVYTASQDEQQAKSPILHPVHTNTEKVSRLKLRL